MKKIQFLSILYLISILIGGSIVLISLNSGDINIENNISNVNNFHQEVTESKLKFAGDYSNFSKYNLSLLFIESSSSVEGNLTVNFYNNDPHNFTQIPFHLYLSGMMYDSRPGSITINDIYKYGNISNKLAYTTYSNDQLMWVNLSDILEPYQRVKFIIQFTSILPDGGYDRANSYGNDFDSSRIYKFGSFYPIPCVYDSEDKWNTDPYLDNGDPFYFDMAYYNLFIEASDDMKIAATGQLKEKIRKGSNMLYHFDPGLPVREVTFSASKYFEIETKMVENVNLSVFYLPKSSDVWQYDAIDYAENALSLYNATFGEYPYATLNIVEEYTDYGGMEYPLQVYATEAIDDWSIPLSYKKHYLEMVIAHEVCHQWWYNLVGNDEVDHGFLDEGLTCWSTDYYGEIYHGDWEHFQYTPYIEDVRLYYSENHRPSKINQSIYECLSTNTDYVFISYYKAPLIFEILRGYVGSSDFINSLNVYFQEYRYKIANLNDFQEIMENVTKSDLDWFFKPMFNNWYLPNYNFKEANYNSVDKLLTFTIEDLSESQNPFQYAQKIPFRAYNDQNQVIYSNELWLNGTTTVNITLAQEPSKISLLYADYILVQLESLEQNSLTYLFKGHLIIPGYNCWILISIILSSSVILYLQKKEKT